MIQFQTKIFEAITVEGFISLRAERKFRLLRNFDLYILANEETLLSISTSTHFLEMRYKVTGNITGYSIKIENNRAIQFDNQTFSLKVEPLYPIRKKYATVFIDQEKLGEMFFRKKGINATLEFVPVAPGDINHETAFKTAVLILLNIADLDGSE